MGIIETAIINIIMKFIASRLNAMVIRVRVDCIRRSNKLVDFLNSCGKSLQVDSDFIGIDLMDREYFIFVCRVIVCHLDLRLRKIVGNEMNKFGANN